MSKQNKPKRAVYNLEFKQTAKLSIIDYLAFYSGKRNHSKPGYQSPLQFEREFYRKAS